MDPGYVELHAHSNFSFLDGASHPEDLVARAALLDMPAVAITDHAGLYGAVRLWKAAGQTDTDAARSAGLAPVRPIVGMEITIPRDADELAAARRGRKLNDRVRGERASRGWPGEFHAGPQPGDHLVLIARDGEGYTALSRLASRGHLAGEKQFPVFGPELVAAALDDARGHLVGLSGCRNGEVSRRLLAGDRDGALDAARRLAAHFAPGDFAIELSHHLQPDDDWLVTELAALAEAAGLPTVVTNEVHYAEAGGHRLQDVLVCIRHGATLDQSRELRLSNGEYRLKSGSELAALGEALPDARARGAWRDGMAWAARIGAECRLDLAFEAYRFPGFPVPDGETPFSHLYQLAHEGLRQRYRPITKQALSQLTHELDVIDRTNLAEFFLIVWDLMEFARREGIIGQGRGSAGDSIVAYALGITKVDPIAHKLLFERFINEARALPDIDIDFDVNRREEVIQYVYDRYGADHAAMVCNVVTYRARSAVREVAKAIGFPLDAVDRLAKSLDTRDASDVARDLALDGSFAWLFEELETDMHAVAVPPGRDGRGHVAKVADDSWNPRPRPALQPEVAASAAGARPRSESGWYPARKPSVLDASVTSVRFEGQQTKRYAGGPGPGELAVPEPRDNGTPGPSSGRPTVVAPGERQPVERPRNAWQWLIQLCAEIDGFPRHLGIHVGGMLVTRTPLIDIVPIERATMPGRVVTQYDKEDVEALGLVKIDLLSLRTLGVVSEALRTIERDTGRRIDLDALPHDDPAVYASVQAADTLGMFQIESRAQMQALPKACPERFEDLVVQVAIIRPGPIQGNAVHPYLRRRAGQEPVTYLHDSLRPILEDTLGVILYQEQVMQIAIAVCGYSALEADIFRKAMGSHRSHREMEREHVRFVEGAVAKGLTPDDAEELFRRCGAFAEFGFARAHAAAFAKICYDTAWLKLYYPAHYVAGVLNNQPMGFYSPAVVVNDAKRHGTRVLPVDVNASWWLTRTERIATSGDARRDWAIRLGLHQVKGIGDEDRERLDAERETGPYRGVRDFIARTQLSERVVERLIHIGAFDWTDTARRELLWELRATFAVADPVRPALPLGELDPPPLGLPPMTQRDEVAADYRETGLSPRAHAAKLYRERLTSRGVIRVGEAAARRDRSVIRLAGLAVAVQHPMTAKNFVFIALEDETGMINVTLRPDVYQRHRSVVHRSPLMLIEGILQKEGEVLNVVARHLIPLDEFLASTEEELPLSRQQRMFH